MGRLLLLEGVIGRAHQRAGLHVPEAHLLARPLVFCEFLADARNAPPADAPASAAGIAPASRCVAPWLRISAIASSTSSRVSPRPEHHPRLHRHVRSHLSGTPQQFQRTLIDRARADLPVQPRHCLQVVVQNVRPRLDHRLAAPSQSPRKSGIRTSTLQPGTRSGESPRWCAQRSPSRRRADRRDSPRSPRHSADPISPHGLRHPLWLVLVRRAQRTPRWHRAKSARARADVPQDHERGRAVLPALALVGTPRALAHGVQIESAQDALQILIVLRR